MSFMLLAFADFILYSIILNFSTIAGVEGLLFRDFPWQYYPYFLCICILWWQKLFILKNQIFDQHPTTASPSWYIVEPDLIVLSNDDKVSGFIEEEHTGEKATHDETHGHDEEEGDRLVQ